MNFHELDMIVKEIEAEPASWRQQHWASKYECGTAYCVAGWAVKRAGYEFKWLPSSGEMHALCTTDGEPIEDLAIELLGLTQDQADLLFSATNSLDQIKDIVAEWRKEADHGVDV